jgi:hypothetical protein
MYSIPLDILFVRYNGMTAYDVYVRLKYTILLENYFSPLLIIKISCIRCIYLHLYIIMHKIFQDMFHMATQQRTKTMFVHQHM